MTYFHNSLPRRVWAPSSEISLYRNFTEQDVQLQSNFGGYTFLEVGNVFFSWRALICLFILHVFTQFLNNYSPEIAGSNGVKIHAQDWCVPFVHRTSVGRRLCKTTWQIASLRQGPHLNTISVLTFCTQHVFQRATSHRNFAFYQVAVAVVTH